MKEIVLTHPATKQLDALDAETAETIASALAAYAIDGRGNVKPLSGRDRDFFRLRIGRYRVMFTDDGATVIVHYIGKRETTTYRKH